MDLDTSFLGAIISEGRKALQYARERDIDPEQVQGPLREVYEYILEHYQSYETVPGFQAVLAKTGHLLEAPVEPAQFYSDEVVKRRLFLHLADGMDRATGIMESHQPQETLTHLAEIVRTGHKLDNAQAKTVPLFSLAPEIIEHYEKIKRGERGIETRWDTLNRVTLGFWPEDLALFAARMGTGKSWVACMVALDAWLAGKRVLLVTTEMSRRAIAARMTALHYRLPYDDFRSGRLSVFEEEKFKQGLLKLIEDERLNLVGGDFDFTLPSLEAAIDDVEPDIVIVDGAYLLKASGDSRHERASNMFDQLKRLAKRHKVPVVATTQLNREAKANSPKSIQADTVALTDVAGWNADLLVGLVQTEDMRMDNRMQFKFLKVRESAATELELTWDFIRMEFEEVDDGDGSSGSAGGSGNNSLDLIDDIDTPNF